MFNFNQFMIDCCKLIDKSKLLKLPTLHIAETSPYCAVIFETRKLPHMELIIRNTIYHLNSNWSLIVMTSSVNFDYYNRLSNDIDSKIKVINMNLPEIISIDKYSLICMSLDFWNLIPSSKILLVQSDSLVLNSNIDKFLKYDYIGAPWPSSWNICSNNCGNGGFSLRSKPKMIEIINQFDYSKTNIPEYVDKWMKSSGLEIIPEDVYFSINMHKIKSILPSTKIARNFSFEGIYFRSYNTIGCHQPIFTNSNQIERLLKLPS